LDCFDRVLENAPSAYNFPEEHIAGFKAFLAGFATWMVNTAPPGTEGIDEVSGGLTLAG
jgi:hypothetical protein